MNEIFECPFLPGHICLHHSDFGLQFDVFLPLNVCQLLEPNHFFVKLLLFPLNLRVMVAAVYDSTALRLRAPRHRLGKGQRLGVGAQDASQAGTQFLVGQLLGGWGSPRSAVFRVQGVVL